MNKKWFTLVELIVVITIIAILWTISFVSFQNYASTARDAKVISDLNNMNKKIALFKIETGFVPEPDNSLEVISGSGNIVSIQGEFGENVKRILNYGKTILDSQGKNYKYAVNPTKSEYSVIGFLETPITSMVLTPTFAEIDQKFIITKWDDIITLFDEKHNLIAGDIQNLQTGEKSFLWKKELISEGKQVAFETCQQLIDKWISSQDGIYKLNLQWTISETYCDFDEKWNAWALLLTADKDSTAFWSNNPDINEWFKDSPLWTIPTNPTEIYRNVDYKSIAYSKLPTSYIKLCMIDSSKCYTFHHQQDISLFDFYDQKITFKEAWYNNYFSEPYEYHKDKIEKFEKSFWDYKVYRYKCGWLGINKITKGSDYSSGIWFVIDNDWGCAFDMPANDGHYDNWALWIGLNSCGDGSTVTPKATWESYCGAWWTLSKSGQQRNIYNNWWTSVIVGPWIVWWK